MPIYLLGRQIPGACQPTSLAESVRDFLPKRKKMGKKKGGRMGKRKQRERRRKRQKGRKK